MRAQIGRTISEIPEALVRVMQEREAKIVGAASGLPGFLSGVDEQRMVIVLPLVSRGEMLAVVTAAPPPGQAFPRHALPLATHPPPPAPPAIATAPLPLPSPP